MGGPALFQIGDPRHHWSLSPYFLCRKAEGIDPPSLIGVHGSADAMLAAVAKLNGDVDALQAIDARGRHLALARTNKGMQIDWRRSSDRSPHQLGSILRSHFESKGEDPEKLSWMSVQQLVQRLDEDMVYEQGGPVVTVIANVVLAIALGAGLVVVSVLVRAFQ